jgi:hypothetical protein
MTTTDMPTPEGPLRQRRWWWIVSLVLIGVLFLTVATLAQTVGPDDSISTTVGGKVFSDPRVPEV